MSAVEERDADGRILDEALLDAGIPRDRAYVTNAVKHFEWKPRGKRRIRDKPSWSEVAACGGPARAGPA